MTRSRRGRRALIARGLLLLAALLLLPLAATLQTPRESAAQAVAQDSLWVGAAGEGIAACANPSSSAALASCFSSMADRQGVAIFTMATDGEHVYVAGESGGLSCPVGDLGANCIRIMAGPWPATYGCGDSPGSCLDNEVLGLAAANGSIWIGQKNGYIYRCPANLPYADQDTMPSQCTSLDRSPGGRVVNSLLLANGRLYAGLGSLGNKEKWSGLIWSCSPDTASNCSTLDSYGDTTAFSLAAGGGYLWAGLGNGILWRCDLNAVDACKNWDRAGASVVSLSYGGAGTIYAAINGNGVIWSCLTAYTDRCGDLIPNVFGNSVAAGAGSVFSTSDRLRYGTNPFTAASTDAEDADLLYIPADGPAGVGGVSLTVKAKALSQKLEKRCDKPRQMARATVTVTGPAGFTKTMKAGACALVKNGAMKHRVDLLDPGDYTVSVQAGKHSGKASFTIVQNRTRPVNIKLTRDSEGG